MMLRSLTNLAPQVQRSAMRVPLPVRPQLSVTVPVERVNSSSQPFRLAQTQQQQASKPSNDMSKRKDQKTNRGPSGPSSSGPSKGGASSSSGSVSGPSSGSSGPTFTSSGSPPASSVYSEFKGELPPIMGKHSRVVKALFDVAVTNGTVETVENDMKTLLNIARLKNGFFKTLYRATWTKEQNVNFVGTQLVNKLNLSPETASVLSHLTSNKDLEMVPRLARAYLEVVRHVRGEMHAVIVSAEPLTEAQQKAAQSVFNAIGNMRSKKSVFVSYKVEPTIVGGLRFFIDEKEFLDFSIAQEIDAFEDRLESQVHAA